MASKAQDPGTSRWGGLFDSLKVLTATLIAIAHTRLELLSTELEEERVRLSPILGWRLVSTRDWEAQLPRIAAIGFNLVGRRPHKLFRPGGS